MKNKYVLFSDSQVPEGFRKLNDEEIAKDFLKLDVDKSYTITKNEWMLTFIKLLENDLPKLEEEGPDSIMDKIQELSDEFDKYDLDHNKCLDYLEYKNLLSEKIYISE